MKGKDMEKKEKWNWEESICYISG